MKYCFSTHIRAVSVVVQLPSRFYLTGPPQWDSFRVRTEQEDEETSKLHTHLSVNHSLKSGTEGRNIPRN